MPYKPFEAEKIYWTIGEVADMFGVNASLIRFWEKEFDIISPHKNKKGNRMFTKEDVENIRIIFHLVKERGYTLQGAREKLKQNKGDTTDTVEIVKSLNKIREFLIELRKEIHGEEKQSAVNSDQLTVKNDQEAVNDDQLTVDSDDLSIKSDHITGKGEQATLSFDE